MRYHVALSAGVVLLATACEPRPAPAPQATAIDTLAAAQGLAALRNQYITAQTAGDAAGLAALHADSAGVDLFGVPRLRGRAAIAAALTADFAARKYTMVEINPTSRVYRTDSDATELGTYHDVHDVKGVIDHEWGRYAGAFMKEADGQWRIAYLIAFPDSTKVDK